MAATTIVIRCPSFPDTNFTLQVDLRWPLLQVKEALAEQYPSKPPVGSQRIIHGGKLRSDVEVLADIFSNCESTTTPTLHLVIKAESVPTPAPAPSVQLSVGAPGDSELRQRRNVAITPPTSASSTIIETAPVVASTPVSSEAPEPNNTNKTPVPPPPQQNAWPQLPFPYQVVLINGIPYALHSAFAQPHIPTTPQLPYPAMPHLLPAQYPFPPHIPGLVPPPAAAPAPHAVPQHQPAPPPPQPQQPAPAAPAAPAPNPAPANAAAAAFGLNAAAAAPPDEFGAAAGGANRIQNAIWLLIKMTFLLYLFNQNASLERMILLNVIALVIFLFQTGVLRFRRVNGAAAGAPAAPGGGVGGQAQDNGAGAAAAAAAAAGEGQRQGETGPQDGAAAVVPPAPVVQRSWLEEVKAFVSGFVTSLVPEGPVE
ncbi:hypothetical protein HDV00_002797 [Rhizophlyctis rosea]|nr:hypothetical protein HDV00_002797 [Rhizophlyctis rosea]